MNFAAGALLSGVDDAAVEGTGVDVQADGALVEFSRVEHTVNGFERINSAGMRSIHLYSFGDFDTALAEGDILIDHVEVLHQQAADGNGHPAVLVAVVVDGAGLADFPADGD